MVENDANGTWNKKKKILIFTEVLNIRFHATSIKTIFYPLFNSVFIHYFGRKLMAIAV